MSSGRGRSPCDTGPRELRLDVIRPGPLAAASRRTDGSGGRRKLRRDICPGPGAVHNWRSARLPLGPLQAREPPSNTLAACTECFPLAATSTRSATNADSTAARSTRLPPSREFALSPTDGRR